eukprot:2950612-Ditylum_brightwellii.AAC.2
MGVETSITEQKWSMTHAHAAGEDGNSQPPMVGVTPGSLAFFEGRYFGKLHELPSKEADT